MSKLKGHIAINEEKEAFYIPEGNSVELTIMRVLDGNEFDVIDLSQIDDDLVNHIMKVSDDNIGKKEFKIGNLLCVANEHSKWGILNPELETVVPFEYDNMFQEFSDSKNTFCVAAKNGTVGLINLKNGEYIKKFDYTDDLSKVMNLPIYKNNISLIKEKDGKFGITDGYGNFVVQPIYDKIEEWNFQTMEEFNKLSKDRDKTQFYLIHKDDKIGIATNEKVYKEPVFDDFNKGAKFVDRFYSYFEASIDEKYGYVDKYGNTIIDFKYYDVDCPDYLNLTIAETFDESLDFINLKTGKVIYNAKIENIAGISIEHNHICILTKDDKQVRVIDETGEKVAQFTHHDKLNGMKIKFLNKKLLVCSEILEDENNIDIDSKKVLYSMAGIAVKTSKNYRNYEPIAGTNNIIAYGEKFDDIIDENGNILLENMVGAYCLGNDENGYGYPPVCYYKDGVEEEQYTDKSITPYEEKTDATEDDSISLSKLLNDDDEYELIDEDDEHYAYIISDKTIRIIDKKGNTKKELDFIADEYDYWNDKLDEETEE